MDLLLEINHRDEPDVNVNVVVFVLWNLTEQKKWTCN